MGTKEIAELFGIRARKQGLATVFSGHSYAIHTDAYHELEKTLDYFRAEGLTDDMIRRAITPMLFALLAEIRKPQP